MVDERRPKADRRARSGMSKLLGTKVTALVALLAALVVVAGCGSGGDSETTSTGAASDGPSGVLRIGLTKSFGAFDPTRDGGGQQSIVRSLSNEPIVRQDPDGSFRPALATSWRYVGTGNRVFEFTLRDDARFSDGTPVDAAAVKKWLLFYRGANGPFSTLLPIASIDTEGRFTVRLNFSQPMPVAPTVLAGWLSNWGLVTSPRALNAKALGSTTNGAGPYVLVPSKTVQGDTYTYVPNKYYYDQSAIHYREVVVKIIPTASTMLQAIQTGQVQFAVGDPSTADAAESAGLKVARAPAGAATLIFMDRTGDLVPALRDPRVRQALNYAIDREAISEGLARGSGAPTSELLSTDGFDESYRDHYPYDPAKARALLAEAGYPDGFTFTVVDATFFGNTGGAPVTQAISKYLDAVGVKTKVTTAATNADYQQKALSGDFAAMTVPWDSNPMYYQYNIMLGPRAVLNPFGASDSELNRLFAEGSKATPEDAEASWQAMSRQFTATDPAFLPAFAYDFIYYSAPELDGVAVSPNLFYPSASQWFPAK